MSSDDFNDDDLTDEELEHIVQAAVGELLNIAALAAELQTTDEAAEEIYTMCDLVAEYMGIQRALMDTVENPDGSYTTTVRTQESESENTTPREPIPGVIRTRNAKFRVVDSSKPPPRRTDSD